MQEMKQRIDRITELGNVMKAQLAKLNDPGVKKVAKEKGKVIGAGVGVSFLGLLIAAVASLYILFVIILLVDIGLDRLWLSSLIVVGGFIIIGIGVVAIGVGIISPAAKDLSKTGDDVSKEIKKSGEELKAEMEKLQELAKQEAEEQKKKMQALLEQAKVAAPIAGAGLLVYKLVRRRMKARKEKRRILRVIEAYEESKAED